MCVCVNTKTGMSRQLELVFTLIDKQKSLVLHNSFEDIVKQEEYGNTVFKVTVANILTSENMTLHIL